VESAVKTTAIALATALWTVACAARSLGPPEIVLDRSVCSQCGMLISERIYAAALRASDGHEQVFDDIGCLLAVLGTSSETDARAWFHDGVSGAWIDGPAPVFVTSPMLRTPMAGGVIAFADRAAAERAAATLHATVVDSLKALVAQKGGVK
jgi:copper chaperone NosL